MERQVKTGFIATACALVAVAALAYTISGGYNTTGGYMSGYNSSGDYTVGLGAGAAAYLTNASHSTFLGAASGVGANNANSSIGIGYRALRMSSDCYGCVAIGSEAGAEWRDISNATWINGAFFARPDYLAIDTDGMALIWDAEANGGIGEYIARNAEDNDRHPAIELRREYSNDTSRTVIVLDAAEIVATNAFLRVRQAVNEYEIPNAEHAFYAAVASMLEADRGDGEYLTATDVQDRHVAVVSALSALSNRLAAVESALFSLTNNATGGNAQ